MQGEMDLVYLHHPLIVLLVEIELKCYPGQIRVGHHLMESNFQRLLNFTLWFICTCQNKKFLANVVIKNKACVSMIVTVNTFVMVKRMRYEVIHILCQTKKNDSRQKGTVWSGMSGNSILEFCWGQIFLMVM